MAAATHLVKMARLAVRPVEQMELREVLPRVVAERVVHRLLAARVGAKLARVEWLAAMAFCTREELVATKAAVAVAAVTMAAAVAAETMMAQALAGVAPVWEILF